MEKGILVRLNNSDKCNVRLYYSHRKKSLMRSEEHSKTIKFSFQNEYLTVMDSSELNYKVSNGEINGNILNAGVSSYQSKTVKLFETKFYIKLKTSLRV